MASLRSYLCPVCRAPRQRQLSERVPGHIHLAIGLTVATLAISAYFLGGFENAWRMAFLYLPLWAVAELVHGWRTRQELRCPACNFDPVLYIKDRKAARAEVEAKLQSVAEQFKATKPAAATRPPEKQP